MFVYYRFSEEHSVSPQNCPARRDRFDYRPRSLVVTPDPAHLSLPDLRWTDLLGLLLNVSFLIPLPVLLFIVYRSGAALAVSNRLKYVALGTALTLAGLFTVPSISSWIRVVLLDWRQIQQYNGVTIADKFRDWFSMNHGHALEGLWVAARWLSEVALIVFLIALFRNRNGANDSVAANPPRLLRTAAATAVVFAVSAAILTASKFIYVLIQSSKHPWSHDVLGATPTLGQMMWEVSKLTIQALCLFVPAYIIWKSQPPSTTQATVFPAPLEA